MFEIGDLFESKQHWNGSKNFYILIDTLLFSKRNFRLLNLNMNHEIDVDPIELEFYFKKIKYVN